MDYWVGGDEDGTQGCSCRVHGVLNAGLLEEALDGCYFFADRCCGRAYGDETEVFTLSDQPMRLEVTLSAGEL